MASADTADPEHLVAAIMLHNVDKTDKARFAHLAEMILLLQLLDINATPSFVWNTGLCPLAGRRRFSPFIIQ